MSAVYCVCGVSPILKTTLCGLYCGRCNMLPASGELNSLPERSPGVSMTLAIVLHPYTKFEVRRRPRSDDMADFRTRR